jgi:hypothetical protein
MRPLIRRVLLVLVCAALLVPATASAVTVDEIVALAKAGVTDAVILALIDRDKTIFALEPDQLVTLQSQGVSEPVILAMLKSGREEGERAAQAADDLKTALYFAERSPGPEVVVIGHGPDTPNAPASDGFYSGTVGGAIAVPYAAPYYAGGRRARGRVPSSVFTPYAAPAASNVRGGFPAPFVPVTPAANIPVIPPSNIPVIPPVSRIQSQAQPQPARPRTMCRADIRGASSAFPLTTIVECPAAMVPARAR